MSFQTVRPKNARGFTLIELLIVVIILAILAAIAIPQFSSSTVDARNAALDANLATIRSGIEQYRVQHTNQLPAAALSSGGACTGGTAGTGSAGSPQALIDQLTMPSNAAGQTCSIASTTYRFGPYLRQGMPNDPITNRGSTVADVTVNAATAPIVPTVTTGGWAYSSATGQFVMNSTTDDGAGRAYYLH